MYSQIQKYIPEIIFQFCASDNFFCVTKTSLIKSHHHKIKKKLYIDQSNPLLFKFVIYGDEIMEVLQHSIDKCNGKNLN